MIKGEFDQAFKHLRESVYRVDLRCHPNNAWALHGLAECLERQDKTVVAAEVRLKFDTAAVHADVEVDRSCFCRMNVVDRKE